MPWSRVAGGAVISAVLLGCGTSGASPATPSASAPTATTEPLATILATGNGSALPTAMPTSALYGPVTVVEGTSVLVSGDSGTQSSDPDGSLHSRGGVFTLQDTMNDPRVSGVHTVTNLAMDFWGDPGGQQGALVQWGDERIENDLGAWVGVGTGTYSYDRGDLVVAWLRGTGAYEGLTYYMSVDSLELYRGATTLYRVRGQIFPGAPPVP